ncbi:Natural cytotoxicity triggering receptor 1 [Dissostichus eleginoides]|uniref:Natural cytotoxicity triggering receptor 1 n=1 Tax=Dissostichus eleginoides TaxID=100907 RepID=A0AAD9CHL5_DISEL|nr:Natural cytotoxicity triggering receptor 1 [Dissostichus eleginoides]
MAEHLLVVILIYLLPPTLTVNPPVITETDSVTLHCQTPPSVSVSECYFRTVRGKPGKVFPCRQTLTGTELLEMAQRSSPAEVNVTCFYLHAYPSPESDVFSVIIRTLPPPTLTVNPPVITETDSVTLHCHTPPSVSVSQCNFYTLSGGTRDFPCLETLKGTELLEIDTSSINIHSSSVTTPGIKDSSNTAAPQKTASAEILKFVAVVAGFGVTVGLILLVSAILCNNRRTAGSQEVKGRQEHHNENMETYHMYAAISEEPPASDLKSIMYSTVQSH